MASDLKFKMEIPLNLRLKIDGSKVTAKIGNRLAKDVRDRLESGRGADGALPAPKPNHVMEPAGRPLNRTGQMIRSVKYDKKSGLVLPTGRRTDGKRNMAVLAINIAKRSEVANADPMGVSDEMDTKAAAVAEREIDRQLKSGEGGLVAELRKIK